MRRLTLLLTLLLIACQPMPNSPLTPFLASAAPSPPVIDAPPQYTPLPTRTPKPLFASATPTLPPTETLAPPATATLEPTLPPLIFPTGEFGATWTPPPDSGVRLSDHFVLEYPVAALSFNRTYPYGGTYRGQLQVHHGIDLVNPIGTPIHAAGDGTVVYAGDDYTRLFALEYNYYGHLVIIQHNFLSPEGLPVFTLYGHMAQITARAGQSVRTGDIIGTVGATGIALGPHLHLEVRVGSAFAFDATRNPEMWLRPPQGVGVLAGRVTDASGSVARGAALTVRSSGATRYAYSYNDYSVNSDPLFGENFTLGSLPADYYTVSVDTRYARTVFVYPDRITWLDIRLNS